MADREGNARLLGIDDFDAYNEALETVKAAAALLCSAASCEFDYVKYQECLFSIMGSKLYDAVNTLKRIEG